MKRILTALALTAALTLSLCPAASAQESEQLPPGTEIGKVYATDIVTYLDGMPMPSYNIGGKTATSEKLPRSLKKYISSFIGFAPADDPEVLALITIDEPQGVYYGGTIAAPVIADIFENILPYLGIQAEEEETVSAFRIYG